MSDFLVNLARRSAGLATVMDPRPAPAAVMIDDAESEARTGAEPGESPALPVLGMALSPDPRSPEIAPASEARQQAPAAPLAVAAVATPAPLVQRAPLAVPAASLAPLSVPSVSLAPPVSSVMPTAESTSVEIPRPLPAPEPAPVSRTAAPPSGKPIAIEPRGQGRIETPARPEAAPAAVTGAPVVRGSPLTVPSATVERQDGEAPCAPPSSRQDEIARHETRVIEPRIERMESRIERRSEPTTAVVIEPAEAAIEPAPLADFPLTAAPVAPSAEPMAERTVHVRIGAIEIHAAPPVAPLPSSPPAAAAPPVLPAGEFDELARLRSYAPWEW